MEEYGAGAGVAGVGVAALPAGEVAAVVVPTAAAELIIAAGFTIAPADAVTAFSEGFAVVGDSGAGASAGFAANAAAGLTGSSAAGATAPTEAGAAAAGEAVSAIDGPAAIALEAMGACAGVGFSSLGGGSGGMAE